MLCFPLNVRAAGVALAGRNLLLLPALLHPPRLQHTHHLLPPPGRAEEAHAPSHARGSNCGEGEPASQLQPAPDHHVAGCVLHLYANDGAKGYPAEHPTTGLPLHPL